MAKSVDPVQDTNISKTTSQSATTAVVRQPHRFVRCGEPPAGQVSRGQADCSARCGTRTFSLSASVVCCYRLVEGGGVVVAEGHPTSCACRDNKVLYLPDAKYAATLPAYDTIYPPVQQWDDRQRFLNLIISYGAEMAYPFDRFGVMTFNPRKQSHVMDSLADNSLTVEVGIAGAAVLDSPKNLQYRQITNAIPDPLTVEGTRRAMVFYAICGLALLSSWLDDASAWSSHMQLIKCYLDAHGGLEAFGGNISSLVSHANVDGAINIGRPPFLPFIRKYPLLPSVLPSEDLRSVLSSLRPRLQTCKIDTNVMDTVVAVGIFLKTVEDTGLLLTHEKFDPDHLMEAYYGLQYDLVTYPRPLTTDQDLDEATQAYVFESYLEVACVMSLETAIRVTALMCLRAVCIQRPWGKAGHIRLLERQVQLLRDILSWSGQISNESTYIDPTLINGESSDAGWSLARARPLLIWICIIGHQVSLRQGVYHHGWSDHHPCGSVFLQTLGQISIHSEMDFDQIPDMDLEVIRTLNISWATNNAEDPRVTLRRMLRRK